MGSLNLRDFSGDVHHSLRVAAAKRDVSIKDLVERIVREWLEREGELPEKSGKRRRR